MTQATYIKQFNGYDQAFDFMKMKNLACEKANNKVDMFCVVPGHDDDNFAVVDLKTAVELGMGYVWSSRGFVANPW